MTLPRRSFLGSLLGLALAPVAMFTGKSKPHKIVVRQSDPLPFNSSMWRWTVTQNPVAHGYRNGDKVYTETFTHKMEPIKVEDWKWGREIVIGYGCDHKTQAECTNACIWIPRI